MQVKDTITTNWCRTHGHARFMATQTKPSFHQTAVAGGDFLYFVTPHPAERQSTQSLNNWRKKKSQKSSGRNQRIQLGQPAPSDGAKFEINFKSHRGDSILLTAQQSAADDWDNPIEWSSIRTGRHVTRQQAEQWTSDLTPDLPTRGQWPTDRLLHQVPPAGTRSTHYHPILQHFQLKVDWQLPLDLTTVSTGDTTIRQMSLHSRWPSIAAPIASGARTFHSASVSFRHGGHGVPAAGPRHVTMSDAAAAEPPDPFV